MPDAPDAHEPELSAEDTPTVISAIDPHVDAIEGVTLIDQHATGDVIIPLAEVVASTGALAAAASTVVKTKIEKRAEVRRAEIEAETRRLEIEAETRRTQIRESAETRRERIRQENAQPGIEPPSPATPST
ncbi:hypothetical protein ACFWJT_18280 [Streptomyces sp. NPDC127069]|uniref:hypothetical protein n=1 Tax=Streptomyces sp. NPDC127069 TaxID=3347128 RepID=UPI0036600440